MKCKCSKPTHSGLRSPLTLDGPLPSLSDLSHWWLLASWPRVVASEKNLSHLKHYTETRDFLVWDFAGFFFFSCLKSWHQTVLPLFQWAHGSTQFLLKNVKGRVHGVVGHVHLTHAELHRWTSNRPHNHRPDQRQGREKSKTGEGFPHSMPTLAETPETQTFSQPQWHLNLS